MIKFHIESRYQRAMELVQNSVKLVNMHALNMKRLLKLVSWHKSHWISLWNSWHLEPNGIRLRWTIFKREGNWKKSWGSWDANRMELWNNWLLDWVYISKLWSLEFLRKLQWNDHNRCLFLHLFINLTL